MRTYRSGRPLSGFAARNAAVTACPQGHDYDEANTGWYAPDRMGTGQREQPSRYCKACHRTRERDRKARRRAA